MTSGPGCGSHAGLGAELRAVAVLALERLEPLLDRATGGTEESARPQSPQVCAVCPVCAVIALLRGERPELGMRLAEHAAGLLAVLQDALQEGCGAAAPGPTPAANDFEAGTARDPARPNPARPASSRRVHRITVERPARAGTC